MVIKEHAEVNKCWTLKQTLQFLVSYKEKLYAVGAVEQDNLHHHRMKHYLPVFAEIPFLQASLQMYGYCYCLTILQVPIQPQS